MATTVNNRLAKAVATIVPDETLATIDVYKEKATGIVNSIQDQLKSSGIDIGALVRGGASVAKMLPSIINQAGKLSKGSILERLAASSSLSKSVFGALPKSLQEGAGTYLKDVNDLTVSVAGAVRLANTTDFTNVKALGEFVNKVYGSDLVGFTDPNAKAGLMIGLIGDCQKAGIGNVFNQMTDKLTGDVLNKVAAGCVNIGVEQSDITLLKDVSDKMSGGFIKSVSPNVIQDFAKNFTVKETLNPVNGKALFAKVTETFDQIDGDWLRALRPGDQSEVVLNAKAVTGASPDFLDLVNNNVLQPMGEAVSNLGTIAATKVMSYIPTPKESIRDQFPRLVLSEPAA